MKFGGTSVADEPAIRRLCGIVARERQKSPARGGPVVVVSALAGVTDRLLALGALAGAGDEEGATALLGELHVRHRRVGEGVLTDAARRTGLLAALDGEASELRSLAHALSLLREVSPRSLDALAARGELASSRLVAAALADAGLPAVWLDAREIVASDEEYTKAGPLMEETAVRVAARVAPALERGEVPVLGGFIASTRAGATTTLGRGGSDYSAAIIGSCLGAGEIQIWTDVDGMLTADPRIIGSARLVSQLSFGEASELAYFGAKVLHPATILPAVSREIPVRILNSQRPDGAGTRISAAPAADRPSLTAIACKADITVIDITSTRMLMAYGFLRRVFEIFERYRTPVDVVTTSEVSVSITIDDRTKLTPILEELSAFADVSCEHEMALVCAVGDNLWRDPGLFARVVRALGDVPLRVVSQAASRRNITMVVRQVHLRDALERLHVRFFADGNGD